MNDGNRKGEREKEFWTGSLSNKRAFYSGCSAQEKKRSYFAR